MSRLPVAFGLAIVAVAVGPGAAFAASVRITHASSGCIPAGRFPRIVATASPPDHVAAAAVEFRLPGGAWYAARMARDGDRLSAYLPRAAPRIERLEYRIVVTDRDGARTAADVVGVTVAAECASTDAAVDLPAAIVVRVPSGAPLVPPVPSGFSPAGVIAEERPPGSGQTLLAAAGVAAGGGAVAAATLGGGDPETEIPQLFFASADPPDGSAFDIGFRTGATFYLRMSAHPERPFFYDWRAEFLTTAPQCTVSESGARERAYRSLRLGLGGSFLFSAGCGAEVATESVRLTVTVEGVRVYGETLPLRYAIRR